MVKSSWVNKVKKKTKGSWKAARNVAAKPRGQRLPGGLIRAVGQLDEVIADETDDGTPRVAFKCICRDPSEHAGAQFYISHYFEEPRYGDRTLDDVLAEFSTDLQLLGADTEDTTEEDWERLMEELTEAKPYFYFNSRAGKKNPDRVYFSIQGLAEDYDPEAPEDAEAVEEDGEDPPFDPDEDAPEDEGAEEDAQPEDGDDDVDPDWEPAKGECWFYKSGPRAKAAECEVTSVNKRERTVGLKRLADGKTFSKVSWDKLLDPPE